MVITAILKAIFRARHGKRLGVEADGEGIGLVVVADGVGGLDLCGAGLCLEVARAGLPLGVRVVCWGHGLGRWHADLTRVENHASWASTIVEQVQEFRDRRPKAPVFLIGKSGGTGVVVRVLEALPADSVERVVLLAPALSPSYDLTQALRAVRQEMVVFWSPLDLIVLGLGTRIFGTIDRVRSVSAGLVGFRPPPEADYAKLRQVRWHPEMAPTGNLGGHVGPDNPAFLRKYVIPLLHAGPVAETVEGTEPVSSPVDSAPIT